MPAGSLTTTIEIEARDRASAVLQKYGGNVAAVGQKQQQTAVASATMGRGVSDVTKKLQQSLGPLQRFQSISSMLGIGALLGGTVAISGLVMGLKGMISGMIESQKAFTTFLLNSQRMGLSIDNARLMMAQFKAILGSTAATVLAQMDEGLVKMLDTMREIPGMQEHWIKLIGTIAKFSTKDAQESMKEFKKIAEEEGTEVAISWLEKQAMIAESSATGAQRASIAWRGFWDAFVENVQRFFFDPTWWIDKFAPIDTFFSNMWNSAILNVKLSWMRMQADWQSALFGEEGIVTALQSAGLWIGTYWDIAMFSMKSAALSTWGFLASGWTASIKWLTDIWGKFGDWWAKFSTGVGDFWAGVWRGVQGVVLGIYNWIIDRLNDALRLINWLIGEANKSLGIFGIAISPIAHRFERAGMPGAEAVTAPTYLAPTMARAATTIVVPIYIGDEPLKEIIIDTLTGAVREREISP